MSRGASVNPGQQPPASADVIVVGAGLAGSAAALAAAERGATVCLLEKGHAAGGSTVKAAAGCSSREPACSGGTAWPTAPSRCARRSWRRAATEQPGRRRRLRRTTSSPPMTGSPASARSSRWRRRTATSPSPGCTPPPGCAHPAAARSLHGDGPRPDADGAAARRLTARDGQVTGIRARHQDREVRIGARRGVVLATGGFTQSQRLLRTFAPGWADAVAMGGDGNAGDGLRWPWRAVPSWRTWATSRARSEPPRSTSPVCPARPGRPRGCCSRTAAGAIIVNADGAAVRQRGAWLQGHRRGMRPAARRDRVQVFDQAVMDKSRPVPARVTSRARWPTG